MVFPGIGILADNLYHAEDDRSAHDAPAGRAVSRRTCDSVHTVPKRRTHEAVPVSFTEVEYAALRHTINVRGTVRVCVFAFALAVWSALVAFLLLYSDLPIAALVPLAILASGFEAVHALHVGVERIGRYLQVFYEGHADGPQWETTAMAVGPALPGGGVDPLFTLTFGCCTVLNLMPAALPEPDRLEFTVIAAFHVAFVIRVLTARVAAARQRALELERFTALKTRDVPPRS